MKSLEESRIDADACCWQKRLVVLRDKDYTYRRGEDECCQNRRVEACVSRKERWKDEDSLEEG